MTTINETELLCKELLGDDYISDNDKGSFHPDQTVENFVNQLNSTPVEMEVDIDFDIYREKIRILEMELKLARDDIEEKRKEMAVVVAKNVNLKKKLVLYSATINKLMRRHMYIARKRKTMKNKKMIK